MNEQAKNGCGATALIVQKATVHADRGSTPTD